MAAPTRSLNHPDQRENSPMGKPGNPSLSPQLMREALEALQEHGSYSKAAAMLDIPRTTFGDRVRRAKKSNIVLPKVEFPEFVTEGEEDEPIDDILTRFRKAHQRQEKAAADRYWFPIKIKEDKPYGILWFGDPHLGPNCNWSLLEQHVAIARQPGIYAGNAGDTTDNWPWTGKLAKLWAENDISMKTERRLATWFMFEAGIPWLLWIGGNHDQWNGGFEFYKMLGAHEVPVIDWRAQFTLCHKNGSQTRVDVAHGRKGTSIYNPTHGSLRDAKFGEDCALYVTGHIHTFGLFDYEMPERKTRTWLAQLRGYKVHDRHALVNGYAEGNRGAAILSVIDPETGSVQCFADVELGADYLQWARNR